jgi:hypothetical protein
MQTSYGPTTHRSERGSIFLLALLILIVIFTLGVSLIERAQTAVDRASARNRSERAFHLAEAGIEKALWSLNQPMGWLTYEGESQMPLQGSTVDVTVAPPASARGVFTDSVVILSTSLLPSAQVDRSHSSAIRVIVHKDPRYFAYAVFGDQEVTVGNGTVQLIADSYTSDDGDYGGTNVLGGADIATNSTAAGAITIRPQGEVYGNVSVGAGVAVPETAVDNMGLITGEITSLDAPSSLPSVSVLPSSGMTELGDVWLDAAQELVLEAGVYHMTDLDIFGSAQIICNGKVTIYIDQTADVATPDVRIGGSGIVNTSQIPANLTMFFCEDVVSIDISGNAAIYAGIYAPNADIRLNSGEVFGSVVGKSVDLKGATAHIHYDEALRDQANPHAVMRSWEVF